MTLEKRKIFQDPLGLASAQLLLPWPEPRAAVQALSGPRPAVAGRVRLGGPRWPGQPLEYSLLVCRRRPTPSPSPGCEQPGADVGPRGPWWGEHRTWAGCPPRGEPLACTGAACLWLQRASWLDRWVGWFRRRPHPCPLVHCSPDVVHPGLTQAARGPQASWTAVR